MASKFCGIINCPKQLPEMKTKQINRIQKRRKPKKKLSLKDGFYEVYENFWIIRSPKHMAAHRDICTNIACYVYLSMLNPIHWDSKLLEMILMGGEQLYMDSILTYNPSTEDLNLQNIVRRVLMADKLIEIQIFKPISLGFYNEDMLTKEVKKILWGTTAMIMNVGKWWVTIFYKDNCFYFFNPYGVTLNKKERLSRKCGYVCLMKFGLFEMLIRTLKDMFCGSSDEFFVVLIDVGEGQYFRLIDNNENL